MAENTREYTNGDITVVWKPDQCIHSKICWTGLLSVFDPRKRPWVNIEGSDTETIVAQVDKCPSGALSYFKNEKNEENSPEVEVDTLVEVMKNGGEKISNLEGGLVGGDIER